MVRMKERYQDFLKKNDVEEDTIKKSFYYLQVLFYECLKILVLFVVFWSIGEVRGFLVLLVSILAIRTSLGGKHFSTQWACLLASTSIFSALSILGKYCILPEFSVIVLLPVSCAVIYLLAPIASKNRPVYSQIQKRRFKVKGITAVICLCIAGMLFPEWKNYILWAVTEQIMEAVLVTAFRKGGRKNDAGICSEGQ